MLAVDKDSVRFRDWASSDCHSMPADFPGLKDRQAQHREPNKCQNLQVEAFAWLQVQRGLHST